MLLYASGPRDGLPSWQPHCLAAQALLAFHGVRPRLVEPPPWSGLATGELPALVVPQEGGAAPRWVGHSALLGKAVRARLLVGSSTAHVDDACDPDTLALWGEFVEQRLAEAVLASWYLDDANAASMPVVTQGRLPWPLDRTSLLHKYQEHLLKHLRPELRGDPLAARLDQTLGVLARRLQGRQVPRAERACGRAHRGAVAGG